MCEPRRAASAVHSDTSAKFFCGSPRIICICPREMFSLATIASPALFADIQHLFAPQIANRLHDFVFRHAGCVEFLDAGRFADRPLALEMADGDGSFRRVGVARTQSQMHAL